VFCLFLGVKVARTESKPDSHHAYRVISRDEILARLHDPALLLVNVMPKETFEAGHIPRSINLPVAEIEERARQVLPDVTQEIAVYCAGST
jgi:rhodanese-related sulfurtransferase